MSETTPPPHHPRASILIAFVLGLQLILATSYYLSDDRYDERFAWRMYSTIRLASCKTEATEQHHGGPYRATVLRKHIAVAWISNIRRNRERVIRAALETRCADPDVTAARLVNVCRVPGEEPVRYVWDIECETGEIAHQQGGP